MTIINHAIVVVRIIDREAISSKKSNKAKSKERAEILQNRNAGLPEPPVNLRKIRNDFEHFEERLDEWASAPNPNIHIDLNMGDLKSSVHIGGMGDKDIFRHLDGLTLTFWNTSVDLQDVTAWIKEIHTVIEKNSHTKQY